MASCVPVPLRVYPKQTVGATCPNFFLQFARTIDATFLLSHITLTVEGKAVPLVALTADEIQADSNLAFVAARSKPGSWVAFRATENLIPHSGARLRVGRKNYDLRISPRLEVLGIECEDTEPDGSCVANEHWLIRFSTAVANAQISDINLAPSPGGLALEYFGGDRLRVHNNFAPLSTHHVTVSPDIRDIYGQKLARAWTGELRLGHAAPAEWFDLPDFQILAARSRSVLPFVYDQ